MASIRCWHCKGTHSSVHVTWLCHNDKTWTCGWQYETSSEDGPVIAECAAAAYEIPGGHTCENGHEHINIETRMAQGWDYAEDRGEAERLMRNGTYPVQMDGSSFIW